jgi:tRNA pseudouridine38-40 synthase
VVSFVTDCRLPTDVFRRALNGNLPQDVHASEVRDAPQGFHAIRDAIGKRYRYVIQDGPEPDIFARRYAWRVPSTLDAVAMHAAAQTLLGTHDFSSFEASGSPRKSAVRTVTDIFAERRGEGPMGQIVIEVAADGFLYNMVRNIVGALFEIGRGARPAEWIAEVLAARTRKLKYPTAPPQGLFLVEVDYKD